MARINLLPWREAERKKRQRDFGLTIVGSMAFTLLLLGYSHFHIEGMIDGQKARNSLLKKEIALVDQKIAEIKNLEKTKANLLARMNIIQELQSSRPQVVHLFDELVSTLPEGAYLTELKQQGAGISVEGRAQSNARVSAYMRNIDASHWLGRPLLKLIENKDKTDTGLSHFKLAAQQVVPAKEGAQ